MKKVRLSLLVLRIEYHWWQVKRQQMTKRDQRRCWHRYLATQLQNRYDILVGIRRFDGSFC